MGECYKIYLGWVSQTLLRNVLRKVDKGGGGSIERSIQ